MDVPLFVTVTVVAGAALAPVALGAVLRRAAGRVAPRAAVAVPVTLVLLTWLALTTVLSAAGTYLPREGEVVPVIGLAFLAVLGGAWLSVAFLPALRAVLSRPEAQAGLIAVQVWRVLGLNFLLLMAGGQLPALFALPAGLGDIAIGIAAPFVARRLHQPGGRSLAVAWNLLGFADLVMAVTLGSTTTQGVLQRFITTPASELLAAFPMALVPTLLVPLSMALHVVSLRYLLALRSREPGMVGAI
ncbi:MAG TPA: hypothetical protein VHS99_10000 [Chloroflexota bacterium]|jgi:hypothetical protein|nr:hypothetical protein [Chloroflexota bacterium]